MIELDRKIIIVGMNYQGVILASLFYDAGYDVQSFYISSESLRKEFFRTKFARANKPIKYLDALSFADELKIIQSGCERKLLVILTSSLAVTELPNACPELWEKYDVLAGPPEAIQKLSDKNALYKSLELNGFDVKPFCLVDDYSSGSFTFPIILKRNIETVGMYIYKFKRFVSEEELLSFIDTIPKDIRSCLILQGEIEPSSVDLDFRGFVHNGEVVASAIVDEIRCFPAGVPSYLEEVKDQSISQSVLNIVETILKPLSYSGFIGCDFKYVPSDHKLYLLDVNCRPPISVSSWLYKYSKKQLMNFVREIDSPSKMDSDKYVRWVNIPRDISARKHSHSMDGLMKSFTAKKDLLRIGGRRLFYDNLLSTVMRLSRGGKGI